MFRDPGVCKGAEGFVVVEEIPEFLVYGHEFFLLFLICACFGG